MTTVHLPRSLVDLFPALPRRVELAVAPDETRVEDVVTALDALAPGLRDRLVEPGPRIREHINVFVDGERADLATPVGPGSAVHVIPAVSGGA